ncbi:hypothetical protein ACFW9L_35655, partial [Streptomyces sp. NPDC059517]
MPDTPGTTPEQPVMVTRRPRAAERSTARARTNAADLGRLAGHVARRTPHAPRANCGPGRAG